MTVPPVGAASGASNNGQAPVSKSMADYETFLKLLVSQMRNQDPTNPMDSTEYVAQLATFSQVEQSIQINKKLEALLESSSMAQVDAVLGRHVTSFDGTQSGIVKEVMIASDGIVAITTEGTKIPIYPGTVITDAPPAAEEPPAAEAEA